MINRIRNITHLAVGLMLLGGCFTAFASDPDRLTLTGTVTDKNSGEPIAYVSILLDDKTTGAETDELGRFTIRTTPGTHTLTAGLIGYSPAAVQLDVSQDLDMELELERKDLLYSQVVVSASKLPVNRWETSGSIEVLDGPLLQSAAIESLADVLALVSSVHVKDGGGSTIKTASIRGSTSNQVLVLINGTRVNNIQTVTTDLGLFSLQNVERIEVYRGGNSAHFGSDAVGGIINIITKSARAVPPLEFGVRTGISSFRTQRIGSFASGSAGKLNFFFDYQREFQPDSSIDVNFRGHKVRLVNSASTKNSGSLSLVYTIAKKSRISWTSRLVHRDAGVIENIDNNLPALANSEQLDLLAFNQVQLNTGLFETANSTFLVNHVYARTDYSDPNLPGSRTGESLQAIHRDHSVGGEFRTDIKLNESNRLSTGIEFRHENATSTSLADAARSQTGFFAAHALTLPTPRFFDRLILQPAIRADYYSASGFKGNYRFGAVLLRHGTESLFGVRGSAGTSFREPGLNDLFWRDGFGQGNDDLEPENSVDLDAGIQFEKHFGSKSGAVELNYFLRQTQNLIAWLPSPDGVWRPQNINESVSEGIEWIGTFKWSSFLFLKTSYSWTKALDKRDDPGIRDKQLRYVPRHSVSGTAAFRWNQTDFTIMHRYTGTRYDDAANRVKLAPYHLTDLSVSHDFDLSDWTLTITGAVQNLWNTEYEALSQFPGPSRHFNLGVQIKY